MCIEISSWYRWCFNVCKCDFSVGVYRAYRWMLGRSMSYKILPWTATAWMEHLRKGVFDMCCSAGLCLPELSKPSIATPMFSDVTIYTGCNCKIQKARNHSNNHLSDNCQLQ